jgi:hypothetical protein
MTSKYEYITVTCPACGSVNRKVRRACRYCEGATGVLKRVPVVEETTEELWEQASQLEAQVSSMLDNRSDQVLGSHE